MKLVLPLPDAINRWPKHPMALHRAKNEYRGRAWLAAVTQAMPSAEPPAKVTVRATLYVWAKRDEDAA